MKELDEILEKCIERAAGTMVGNGIVRDHAHTAILSLMKSKQMSESEIISIIVKLPLIVPVSDKNMIARAINKEMLRRIDA